MLSFRVEMNSRPIMGFVNPQRLGVASDLNEVPPDVAQKLRTLASDLFAGLIDGLLRALRPVPLPLVRRVRVVVPRMQSRFRRPDNETGQPGSVVTTTPAAPHAPPAVTVAPLIGWTVATALG
jgi:hypothetical protein